MGGTRGGGIRPREVPRSIHATGLIASASPGGAPAGIAHRAGPDGLDGPAAARPRMAVPQRGRENGRPRAACAPQSSVDAGRGRHAHPQFPGIDTHTTRVAYARCRSPGPSRPSTPRCGAPPRAGRVVARCAGLPVRQPSPSNRLTDRSTTSRTGGPFSLLRGRRRAASDKGRCGIPPRADGVVTCCAGLPLRQPSPSKRLTDRSRTSRTGGPFSLLRERMARSVR